MDRLSWPTHVSRMLHSAYPTTRADEMIRQATVEFELFFRFCWINSYYSSFTYLFFPPHTTLYLGRHILIWPHTARKWSCAKHTLADMTCHLHHQRTPTDTKKKQSKKKYQSDFLFPCVSQPPNFIILSARLAPKVKKTQLTTNTADWWGGTPKLMCL